MKSKISEFKKEKAALENTIKENEQKWNKLLKEHSALQNQHKELQENIKK